jgi:hypothetical protein
LPQPDRNVREAALALIERADLEFEEDDDGTHRLIAVSVPVPRWLDFLRAVHDKEEEPRAHH